MKKSDLPSTGVGSKGAELVEGVVQAISHAQLMKDVSSADAANQLAVFFKSCLETVNTLASVRQIVESTLWKHFAGTGTGSGAAYTATLAGATTEVAIGSYAKGYDSGKYALNVRVVRNHAATSVVVGLFASADGSDPVATSELVGVKYAATGDVLALTTIGEVVKSATDEDSSPELTLDVAILINCNTGEWGLVLDSGKVILNAGALANELDTGTLDSHDAGTKVYPFVSATRTGGAASATFQLLPQNIAGVPADYVALI